MQLAHKHDLARSRWSGRTSRFIDIICLLVLIAVVSTVIYGFALRAIWAHGYFIAVGVAIIGAMAMMIGLAQQAIAARDATTWHDMAAWQLSAARDKVAQREGNSGSGTLTAIDPDSPDYYEELITVFIESVQRTDEGATGI